jgi:hypothetical protein
MADTSAPATAKSARGRHVVLTAEEARVCGGPGAFKTSSAADVKRLDAGLAKALKDAAAREANAYYRQGAAEVLARLSKDVRYYVGTADGFILVDGYCADMLDAFKIRGNCPPMVDDGGSCIWRIRFDIKRGIFDRFGTNGDG